jgi:chromosome segregation protein
MIETALRDELQYVVVPSFDDALRAIDLLKSEGAGRATFLVVGKQHDEANSGYSSTDLSHGQLNSDVGQDGILSHEQLASVLASFPAHQSSNHQPSIRYQTLDSMLGLNPDLAEAFKFALPGLAKASVVDDAAQAIIASSSSNGSGPVVSLALTGERAIAGRLVTGGSASETGIGVLALKREIGELHEGIESLTDEVRATEAGLNEVKSEIAQLEDSQRRLDGELRQIEQRLVALREQTQQCERERERTATHIRVVEQETAQAQNELKDFEMKLQHAVEQTEEAEKAHQDAEAVVAAAQTEMAELRRAAEMRLQELSRRRADFATKTERRRGLQNDIRRLETEAGDLDNRLNRNRLEAIEADSQSISMQDTLASTTERLQQLTAQRQLRAAEVERRAGALAAARQKVELLEAELRSARESASQAREERMQREIEKARLSSDLEHLIQSCQTELGENIVEVCQRLDASKRQAESPALAQELNPAAVQPTADSLQVQTMSEPQSASPLSDSGSTDGSDEDEDGGREIEITFWTVPDDFDLDAAKAQLDELRKKIDALGPVNMMALEELTEVEERFIFLTAQKADIEKAISDTQSAIAEIKRRSRERFVEAFHAINENFKQMFVELFGGGHGEMRLIDESDVLESGIEIIAQPPGKRLQNVLLLSGGEKAMAALSLVMAIFKYRPSPFCLLDEVDAPLDDVNIGRFSDKVIEMSADTQFMIITHSKRTMEAARTLYGVTMEDPGVSKLISVKLT